MQSVAEESSGHSTKSSVNTPCLATISIVNITKSFSSVERALDNVSLEAFAGQSIALIGSDSAGKSTLLRCCDSSLRPDSGKILLFGQDIWLLTPRKLGEIRKRIATLDTTFPQAGRQPMTALQAVLRAALTRSSKFGLWVQSKITRSARDEALKHLATFGCAHLAKKKISELTPFESRCVAAAQLLMQHAELVLADNPTDGLDRSAGERFMDLFVATMKKEGKTLIFTTRELVAALAYADRAVALLQGRVELDAPVGTDDSAWAAA